MVWMNTQETAETLGRSGSGRLVGASGLSYPVAWQSGSPMGCADVVIHHQGSSTTWIPGTSR